jgi:hypothetical protein
MTIFDAHGDAREPGAASSPRDPSPGLVSGLSQSMSLTLSGRSHRIANRINTGRASRR